MTPAEAVDIAWILFAAALVMLMQAGFSALESGLVRTKNSINVAAKNFSDFLLSSAVFWILGFAIMFGPSIAGVAGSEGFFFGADSTPFLLAFFLFQMGFIGTAATIVSGAVAERMRFSSYLIITLAVSALLYPVVGHWAWSSAAGLGGEGWLERLGFIDFAGATVVHSVGGWTALAALLVLGPRIGRFGPGRVPIHGHDLPLVTVGVFILWVGWFGFNGGSTLGLTPEVPTVILNTSLSAVFGGLTALAVSWRHRGLPDVPTIMNGALAGLVGITASANIVTQVSAVAIGVIAGLCMYGASELLVRLRIDDAVGAVPVHLAGGIWGTVAVALFGFREAFGVGVGRGEQLLVQLAGVAAAFLWVFVVAYLVFRLVDRFHPLRISPAGELDGLNISEHGASTEIVDLLSEMEAHRVTGDYAQPVTVEPHTEAGRIARQYNRVLEAVHAEQVGREAALVALRDRTASLQLLQSITAAVNEERELEAAYRVALDKICLFTGWPLGHVYATSADGEILSPTEIWRAPDGAAVAELKQVTAATRLGRGEGLPGHAAERKRALHVVLTENPDPRAAAAVRAGFRAGFAFPVLAGTDVVAVMEFFDADTVRVPDASFLDLMEAVGTQLGRAVERRRADEARFRTVVDHMPAMVLLRDLEGRFLLANRRYEEFYQVAGLELGGRTLSDVVAAAPHLAGRLLADESLAHDREVLATDRTIEHELQIEQDGRAVVLASVKFPIPGPSGQTVGLGGIEIDITERKNHEAELAELVRKVELARDEALRATEAKSRFLTNVSHELRTPLNAIVGFTRLVRRKTDGVIEQRQTDNLGNILRSAEHLMVLINDLLDLSRIEAGREDVSPTVVDLSEMVDDVVGALEPLATERGLQLRQSTTGPARRVLTDGPKLRQVLVNLVGNAVKFTEHGGVHVGVNHLPGHVEIAVTDTGVGIAPADAQRIFEEFERVQAGTTKPIAGTGLGLAISNRIVRLLGGRIELKSTAGEGSVFTVHLPLRYEGLATKEAS